ncbi:MAG TPA: DUF1272 domain-containing protein [Sphingomonas sp.]|nr:DUF1272 domain-containing protein [Sphingomonas sp.]
MLEMRPACERCGRALPPESGDVFICSMECSFCADCAEGPLGGQCPNCRGDLKPRPTRTGDLLRRYPAGAR